MADESMTSGQEAVCGTCGHDEDDHGAICSVCYAAVGGLACQFYSTIPAPVVPSDDAPRREQYATSDEYRAATVEWALSAHPTPSQDAEGDGLYRYEESMGARCCITCLALPGEPHADGCHALALVSAIRAPYEALVQAARSVYIAHHAAYGGCNYGCAMCAAYARIEESLGGRKDGSV